MHIVPANDDREAPASDVVEIRNSQTIAHDILSIQRRFRQHWIRDGSVPYVDTTLVTSPNVFPWDIPWEEDLSMEGPPIVH